MLLPSSTISFLKFVAPRDFGCFPFMTSSKHHHMIARHIKHVASKADTSISLNVILGRIFCFGQSPSALDRTMADMFNVQPAGQLPLWCTACRHLYVFLSSTSPVRIQIVCTWSGLLSPQVVATCLFSWTMLDCKKCLVGLH